MSDQPTDPPATDPPADTTKTDPPKPSETVDYWKAKSRENESRAKSNADAAKELTAIKDAQKSDAEKVADRLAAADTQVASVPAKVAEALRVHLVALHKIPEEDAELFLNASDPETLLKQVQRLMDREATSTADRKKQGNFVPKEGTTSTAPENEERAFARDLFAG